MHLELNPSDPGELPPEVAGAVLVDPARATSIDACYTNQRGARRLVSRTITEVTFDVLPVSALGRF